MIQVRIVNVDHSGTTLSILEDLPEIGYSFVLSDMGEANWVVPLSHPNLVRDQFAPKLTDFRLGISLNGGTWQTIQGGICGPVGLKTGTQAVSVVGYDYLYYLDQPFPFDYASTYEALTAVDLVVYRVGAPQEEIIQLLIDASPLNYTAAFGGTGWDTVMSYVIQYGDTTTLLEHIKAVGALNAPKGFEFKCRYDKLIEFYAPYRRTSGTPIMTFNYVTGTNGLVDIDWSNQGPKATQTVGLANGLKRAYSEYEPSTEVYRSWLELVGLPEQLYEQDDITAATYSIGNLDRNPQKGITITVRPEDVNPGDGSDWFFNKCGEVIYVDSEDYFLPYHRISAPMIITKQDFKLNNGAWLCDISADYIYA